MNRVRVLFFATIRDRTGKKEISVDLPDGAKVKDLKLRLLETHPSLAELIDTTVVSVNRDFAFDEDLVPDQAEVALFPPVSGGTEDAFPTIFQVTEEEFDISKVLKRITLPTTGGACIFCGLVRHITQGAHSHQTDYLDYDAYKPMAEEKMHQIAQEMRDRWPLVQGIAIIQRIGRLYPGTPTVLIACTSAHRDDGIFDAARYGIDRLKEIVPVWKKEVSDKGQHWIQGEYRPSRMD